LITTYTNTNNTLFSKHCQKAIQIDNHIYKYKNTHLNKHKYKAIQIDNHMYKYKKYTLKQTQTQSNTN